MKWCIACAVTLITLAASSDDVLPAFACCADASNNIKGKRESALLHAHGPPIAQRRHRLIWTEPT